MEKYQLKLWKQVQDSLTHKQNLSPKSSTSTTAQNKSLKQAFITLKDHANAIVTTESETAGMKYIGLTEGTEKNFQTARNCQSISGHSKTTTPILQLTGVF